MFRHVLFFLFFTATTFLHADYSISPGIRQTEKGGIGYNYGYTTLEALMFPIVEADTVVPFLDLRGHRLDNNKYAANVGIGGRYYSSCTEKMLGTSLYYDCRRTGHARFHALGLGFELSGACLCLRGNGYLPIGKQRFETSTNFHHCNNGNTLIVKKFKNAFSGADLELEANLFRIGPVQFYAAGGPYYLKQQHSHKRAIGSRFRFELDICKYVAVELMISHDGVFETNAQGQIGIYIPFDCLTVPDCGSMCFGYIKELLTRRIYRREIIPQRSQCRQRSLF